MPELWVPADDFNLFQEEAYEGVPEHDVIGKMGSYINEHPTNFNWAPSVERLVRRVQREFPWQTYACTYFWHPPYDPPAITKRYDTLSVDFWGGGIVSGVYQGYRGKTLPDALHKKIFAFIFNDPNPPYIDWVLTNGWLWTHYGGWSRYNPADPYNADMGHFRHLHFSMKG